MAVPESTEHGRGKSSCPLHPRSIIMAFRETLTTLTNSLSCRQINTYIVPVALLRKTLYSPGPMEFKVDSPSLLKSAVLDSAFEKAKDSSRNVLSDFDEDCFADSEIGISNVPSSPISITSQVSILLHRQGEFFSERQPSPFYQTA